MYGVISELKPGEKPARVVQVPKKTSDTKNVRRGARTIMEVSRFRENVPDDGRHPEATGGLDKLDVRFEVNGNKYDAEITVLVTDNGRVFYDITKFGDINSSEVGQTSAAAAEASSNVSKAGVDTPRKVNQIAAATDNALSVTPDNTIPQPTPIVNTGDAVLDGVMLVNKVRTVHARGNISSQINDETVLYLDEDKKEPGTGSRSAATVCR